MRPDVRDMQDAGLKLVQGCSVHLALSRMELRLNVGQG